MNKPVKGLCKVCEERPAIQRHHLIPKSITRTKKTSETVAKWTLSICNECHEELHDHFLTHIMVKRKINILHKYGAVKCSVLIEFLKIGHKDVFNEFKKFWKGLMKEEMRLIDEEEDKEETDEVDEV